MEFIGASFVFSIIDFGYPESDTERINRRLKTVEILAPAGSYESMMAAIAAGADAVYIGGSRFGARAFADNLDETRLLEAIDYAHLHGRKLYMTVNTLMKEAELSQLFDYLKPYYEHGLDAVIVQDMGVFSFIRNHFPDLPVHASTQMTITGVHGAKTMKKLGASRIVTARELSLEEIAAIHQQTDIEIESFVHGALCYSYSGQCLLSSLIGGRSGNRGRCAQPCRLPYDVKMDGRTVSKNDEKYVLSLKDLCTLDMIPDMIDAGICSMKIEGRMKSPRYTAGVVRIYRKYTDLYLENGRNGYQVDHHDKKLLLDLFDRGGFTEGYYREHNGKTMVAVREKPAFREGNQELFDYLDQTYVLKSCCVPISGQVTLEAGRSAVLTLTREGISVTVEGEMVSSARNQPLTEEKLKKQIGKTGGTPFEFKTLHTTITGDVFIPVQALNELRRQGIKELKEAILSPSRRTSHILSGQTGSIQLESGEEEVPSRLHVSIEDEKMLARVLSVPEVCEVYLDSNTIGAKSWKAAAARCHDAGKKCLLMLPHIFRTEAEKYFIQNKECLLLAGFDGYVIRSLEEIDFLAGLNGYPLVFDASLYTYNHLSEQMMTELGAVRLTLPAELNSRELKELDCRGKELIVYGRQSVMVSAQCIKKTTTGCDRQPGILWIKDRIGKEFPVRNHCRFCYNTVYNTSPLSLLGMEAMVRRLCPGSIRLAFTTETEEEAGEILDAYTKAFIRGGETEYTVRDFTRGHFKRGVE